jgi:membrane protease YdiL (CAAX protease family)/general stress protein 26
MAPDDPEVQRFLKRSMTMRVATLSRGGVPHITPLRFTADGWTIHALPGATTPTVRHIREHPSVVLLFDAERAMGRVLRVRARAAVLDDPRLKPRYERRAAVKYFLRPGGIWNTLTHWRLFLDGRHLRRDNALIEFVPEAAEFVPPPLDADRSSAGEGTVGGEGTGASRGRSPLRFFLLVFALAVPFWLLGALAGNGLPLPTNLPVSALQAVCPLLAALILVHREDRRRGVRRLLHRIVDYRRIRPRIWYVPIMLLVPVIYLLSYAVMRLMGQALPELHIRLLTIPVLLVVFFVAAVGEEGGWTGYAVDPMQARWSSLTAGIILGLVWGALHVVPDLQADRSLEWIAWQRGVYDVGLRILLVWLYNNTGKGVLAAVLAHDTDNVSVSLFPNDGSHYDPAVTGTITAVIAAIVTLLWGATTLARYRRPTWVGSS